MICPCKDCENKGCGVYHDQCEEYQKYVEWRKYVNKKEKDELDKIYNTRIVKRKRS